MRTLLFVMGLLLVPQVAGAGVYMCVDPETGKTSFTDRACEVAGSGEEIKVNPANLGSGKHHGQSPAPGKTWNSERDLRKTGVDYNAQRRLKQRDAAAIANR